MKALLLLALGAVVLAAVAGGAVLLLGGGGGTDTAYAGSAPPDGIALPSFALTDEKGSTVRSDALRGHAVVVTFLDAQCTDACPVVAGELARGVDALTADERTRVDVLGISTDPVTDTPVRVARFLALHRAAGRVRYLTGSVKDMARVWNDFHVLPTLRTGDHSLHSVPVQVYDRDGIWRSTLTVGVDLQPELLVHDIRLALGETP